MPAIAHKGDPISHIGYVIGGSTNVYAQGRQVARVGDLVACLEHGTNRIISGATTVYANGLLVAVNGSQCECGAVVIASGNVFVEEGT